MQSLRSSQNSEGNEKAAQSVLFKLSKTFLHISAEFTSLTGIFETNGGSLISVTTMALQVFFFLLTLFVAEVETKLVKRILLWRPFV